MRIVELPQIQKLLVYSEIIGRMREALIAHSRGECDTPMPMHLDFAGGGEAHMKSSYRRGGRHFALKIAATFPRSANGMMLLSSAETGEPVAFLADRGHLTDARTAAVAALVAQELGRHDRTLGILGTGIQARLQAEWHAQVLPLERIVLWGRDAARVEECRRDIAKFAEVSVAAIPAEVAHETRLIVTCTASRAPLLRAGHIQAGTHISAVGADSPGKQELDPAILSHASLVLVDSRRQCEKLGELQHAPEVVGRAVELGELLGGEKAQAGGLRYSVCDFTGLGVEDLYIAEYCWEKLA